MDSLNSFIARVDGDTARMTVFRRPVDLGAGASGQLVGWRAGRAWQRIRISVSGDGFDSDDTYWLHDGLPVAARLAMRRPEQPISLEQIWFRGPALYRWMDSKGRRLNPAARSTHTEIDMLMARARRILEALPPIDAPPTTQSP